MKVQNMTNSNGNKVPNQFIIDDDKRMYFQSYDTIIAVFDREDKKTYLDEEAWNYSRTTSKYRNIFLGESTKETQKKIDSGEYKLIDLN